jgi:mannose-6-phosphate isomerase-like protein (cupin superfamily)
MAVRKGEGWSVADLHDLGEGPGFRKVRRELEVAEMGVNAIVLPPGVEPGFHFHDEQEEVYFVHRGRVKIEFGDGSSHELGPGGLARVAAHVNRRVETLGDEEAVYIVFGAKGGYVGRDGRVPEDETRSLGH